MIGLSLAERGFVPDPLIRMGIRELLRRRMAELEGPSPEAADARDKAFRRALRTSPIAVHTVEANEQHYEVSPGFFELVLGPHLKYSSGYWPEGATRIEESEATMLELTCRRAEIRDGMQVLDLGCGWGSLSLWIARHFPQCRITSVSNSKPQREFILRRCTEHGLENVDVITADMNAFDPALRFDRVVSVEMIEHMRNWPLLLERVARWLAPGGKAFFHHFAHRRHAYPYETTGEDDWMGRYFFTGGLMPSIDMMDHFDEDLLVERRWIVSGTHYQKTCEAWLKRQDARRAELMPILASVYGEADAKLWFNRWRIFFLACAELFGTRGGEEWCVVHSLLEPRVQEVRR